MKRLLRFIAAASLFLLPACAVGNGSKVVITNTHVPTLKYSSYFDVVDIDQQAHRLYATDRSASGVDVFDVSRVPATYVETISMPATPNGLAVAPDLGRIFVGLSDGTIAFIDSASDKLVKQADTGAKSIDLIDYSPDRHEIFGANSEGGKVAEIDAQDGTKKALINLGTNALEQPRYNPGDQLLYVTSPDAGVIYQIDPDAGVLKQKLSIGTCRSNGLGIDPKHNMALIACSAYVLRVNLHNPTDIHAFTQVAGGDIIIYDATGDRFLVGAPGTKPPEVGVFGGNPIDYIDAVSGAGFGNAAAYDEANAMVYVPDSRQGRAGVDGFKIPTGELALSDIPTEALWAIGVLAVAFVVILFALGRQADPIHRPKPEPARRPSSRREQAEGEVRAGAKSWTRKPEPPA